MVDRNGVGDKSSPFSNVDQIYYRSLNALVWPTSQ